MSRSALAPTPPSTLPREQLQRSRQQGLLIALLVLGVSLLGLAPLALTSLRRDVATLAQGPAVVVEVVADGMRFVPDEIRVPPGASVQIDFVNRDPASPHDFQTTRQYRNTRVVLWPGEKRSTVFISTETPGRYLFLCTLRGHSQAGMAGTIVVGDRGD